MSAIILVAAAYCARPQRLQCFMQAMGAKMICMLACSLARIGSRHGHTLLLLLHPTRFDLAQLITAFLPPPPSTSDYPSRSAFPLALIAIIVLRGGSALLVLSCVAGMQAQTPSQKSTKTHLILKILRNRNTITQPFPPSSLQHQIPRQTLALSRLQRSKLDTRIRRITRNDRPMIKAHLTESLTHSCCSQICLEAVGVEDRDECFHGV